LSKRRKEVREALFRLGWVFSAYFAACRLLGVPVMRILAPCFWLGVALTAATGCGHAPAGDPDRRPEAVGTPMTGAAVVEALAERGYFRYARPQDLSALKQELAASYDRGRVLSTLEIDSTGTPACYRLYPCDAEDLFETGGLGDQLRLLQPTFAKLGVPLAWTSEYFAPDGSEHTIVLNGVSYTAFRGAPDTPDAWGQATHNFVTMLNDQLALHHAPARVYPMLGGNEGYIIFLTDPLYQFIHAHFDEREGPQVSD
jgi:hypothetical protein